MNSVSGVIVDPSISGLATPPRDPDGNPHVFHQVQSGNRLRVEAELRCRVVEHRHSRVWGRDQAAQDVSGPAPALLCPMVVIPNLSLGFEEHRWLYQFGLPVTPNPDPVFTFYGWVNFVVQSPIVNCAHFDIYFWRKPYGQSQFSYLPGWRWAVSPTPASWYQSGLPVWAPLLLYQGDQFGISLRPIGGSFLNPQPFAVDLR